MSEIEIIKKIANHSKKSEMIIINTRQFNKLCAELFTNEISEVNSKLKLLNLPSVSVMN